MHNNQAIEQSQYTFLHTAPIATGSQKETILRTNRSINNTLRILVVGTKWLPETFIQRKLQGLAQRGVDVTVANTLPLRRSYPILTGVKLFRLPHSHDSSFVNVLQLTADLGHSALTSSQAFPDILNSVASHLPFPSKHAMLRLQSYLKLATLKPDLVHFEWLSAAISYAPLFSALHIPFVVSCRGRQINIQPHIPDNPLNAHTMQRVFQQASAVHCVSEAIRDEAIVYGLNPAKARVIRPAVDPYFFQPPAQPREETGQLRLITTGTLIWHKGYEYLLVALRRLHNQGIMAELAIISDGPERQRVLYTIHDLGLEHHVRLLGKLSPEEVRAHLWQADVFVLTSLSEGISNAVLEAMACGLPVVTSDCGGMREAVSDGVEGFVVPLRDPEATAIALARLATDEALRQQMGRAARERILCNFTLDQQIDDFLSMYQAVLERQVL